MSKLLVISIDSMISEDVPLLLAMPALRRLGDRVAVARDLAPVYPALTYPCHVSILTGTYPDRHGIFQNDQFRWDESGDWLWWGDRVRAETMLDIARANGLTTGAVCWPVTCGSPIDYNLGEIWTTAPDQDEEALFARANSPAAMPIYRRHRHLLDGMRTPGLDLYAAQAARDILLEAAPDLMLVHFAYLDHQRHQNGVRSPALAPAFAFINDQLEHVLSALESTGALDTYNVAFLGDHGQLDTHTVFYLNRLFQAEGLLQVSQRRGMMAHAAACSAQIYLRDMEEAEARRRLLELKARYPQYIQEVYPSRTLAERDYVTGDFSFIVEACDGVAFSKQMGDGPLAEAADRPGLEWMHANHGHHPHKGPKPPLVLFGPNARQGVRRRGGSITDIAPTLMEIFGLAMPDADGRSLGLVRT